MMCTCAYGDPAHMMYAPVGLCVVGSPVVFGSNGHISFLARSLRPPKRALFEFAFRLEPIVQLIAWVFAAFEIDLVCATSDLLVTR
jgi:hypothetical protein